jgi:hypothetical protein
MAAEDPGPDEVLAHILQASQQRVFAYIKEEAAEFWTITKIRSVGNSLRELPPGIGEGVRRKRR